jgi:hypothetical protein
VYSISAEKLLKLTIPLAKPFRGHTTSPQVIDQDKHTPPWQIQAQTLYQPLFTVVKTVHFLVVHISAFFPFK